MAQIGWAYATLGQVDRAQELLEELQGLSQDTYATGFSLALIYLGLGEIDKAFDWFDKVAEEHNGSLFSVASDFMFDPLRSHPRYHALLRKMNLEP